MTREQKIYQFIGQVVVYGSMYITFIGIMMYGFMHATTLN